jgi:hypothetical protein
MTCPEHSFLKSVQFQSLVAAAKQPQQKVSAVLDAWNGDEGNTAH